MTGATTLLMGAVAYDPKVVTIWDGFRRYFAASDLDTASTSVGQRCITSLIPVDEWVRRAGLLSGAASGNENRGQRDDRSHWPVLHRPAMGGKCLAKSLPHLKGHNPRPGPFL